MADTVGHVGLFLQRTAPSSPVQGETLWFDTSPTSGSGILKGYDGSAFITIAVGSASINLTVEEEEDGVPSVSNVSEIKVSNGTLTNNGGGSVSISTGGGGAGGLLDYHYSEQTSNQSAVTNTTLTNLVGMAFPIGANEKWVADFIVVYRAGTAGDLQVGLSFPESCAVDAMSFGPGSNLGADAADGDTRWQNIRPNSGTIAALFGGNIGGGAANAVTADLRIRAVNLTNAGTVQLLFAQFSSNATSTTVFGSVSNSGTSFVEARRVG